ncbi:MAG: hypothetical protein ACREVT_04935 [Burkholderiales bacterium]
MHDVILYYLGPWVSAWSKMDSPGYLLITNARWCAVVPVNAYQRTALRAGGCGLRW